mmetsp:Transcript_30137/g.81612  ORF Transcript_30137/g.81612 Transcript_30137/m.81612 type:complete len:340 (-) Transcript_30137:90-1109(-)
MDGLNRVLRNQLRGTTQHSYLPSLPIILPDWVEVGSTLVYISRSKGDAHSVNVAAIDKRKQMVRIRFESDRRVWKLVPFNEIKKFGDGTLRPLWKKTEVATVPKKPKDFVDLEEEEPLPEFAEAVDPTDAAPDFEDDEDMIGPRRPPLEQAAAEPALGPAPAPEVAAEQTEVGRESAGDDADARSPGPGLAEAEPRPEAEQKPPPESPAEAKARAAAAAAVVASMASLEEKPKKKKKAAGEAKKAPDEKAAAKAEEDRGKKDKQQGKEEKRQAGAKADKKDKEKDQEQGGKKPRKAGDRERRRSPSSSSGSGAREKERRRRKQSSSASPAGRPAKAKRH